MIQNKDSIEIYFNFSFEASFITVILGELCILNGIILSALKNLLVIEFILENWGASSSG